MKRHIVDGTKPYGDWEWTDKVRKAKLKATDELVTEVLIYIELRSSPHVRLFLRASLCHRISKKKSRPIFVSKSDLSFSSVVKYFPFRDFGRAQKAG